MTHLPLTGPSVWTGTEMAARTDWIWRWTAAELTELLACGRALADSGRPIETIRLGDVPLPMTAPRLAAYAFQSRALRFRKARTEVFRAPEPSAVVWRNLHVTSRQQLVRKTVSNLLSLLLIVLLSFKENESFLFIIKYLVII